MSTHLTLNLLTKCPGFPEDQNAGKENPLFPYQYLEYVLPIQETSFCPFCGQTMQKFLNQESGNLRLSCSCEAFQNAFKQLQYEKGDLNHKSYIVEAYPSTIISLQDPAIKITEITHKSLKNAKNIENFLVSDVDVKGSIITFLIKSTATNVTYHCELNAKALKPYYILEKSDATYKNGKVIISYETIAVFIKFEDLCKNLTQQQ